MKKDKKENMAWVEILSIVLYLLALIIFGIGGIYDQSGRFILNLGTIGGILFITYLITNMIVDSINKLKEIKGK